MNLLDVVIFGVPMLAFVIITAFLIVRGRRPDRGRRTRQWWSTGMEG
jgi:hypothetical protein